MSRPAAARALDLYLARLDDGDTHPELPDHEESWAALAKRLRADASTPRPAAPAAPSAQADVRHIGSRRHHVAMFPSSVKRPWWRSSAIFTVAAAILAVFVLKTTLHSTRDVPPAPRTYETNFAQRAEVRLTDGTRVVLAPGSKLRVATDFGNERRDLYLEGEAFFDVVHDEQRPFTVYAGNASAHDIGTAFSVRNYAEDRAVQIVVREGVVAMSGVGRLNAGDVGRLTSEGMTSVRHNVDVGPMLGWLDGKLAFEDAPLSRVVADLRRWHHVEIQLRDSSLASLPFTGAVDELATSKALELVARTLGLRLTRDDNNGYVLAAIPGRTPNTARRPSRRASSLSP